MTLKSRRENAKLTIPKLAKKAKLDERTVRGLEAAETVSTWDSLPRIASLIKYLVGCGLELAQAQELAEQKLRELREAAEQISLHPAIELILHTAINQNVSDVHIEPNGVRFRKAGILAKSDCTFILPEGLLQPRDRISSKNFTLSHNGRSVSVRSAIIGDRHVYHIASEVKPKQLEEIFVSKSQLRVLRQKLNTIGGGLIIVSGGTGHGTTTTAYAILEEIALHSGCEKNIMTAEDPIERMLPGIRQWNVDSSTGNDIGTLLKNFIRADPDIIAVGEIRDRETAELAMNAAITGKLVIATMCGNSASGVIARLQSLGISRELAEEYVILAINQMLEFVEDRTDRFAIVEMYAAGKVSSRESCLVAAVEKGLISEQTYATYVNGHCSVRRPYHDELAQALPEVKAAPFTKTPSDSNS